MARSILGKINEDRRHWLPVLALVILAAVLRLWDLGAESLWTDELSTLIQISNGPAHAVSETLRRGTPPVYYLIQTALYAILPTSEASLRLLSALADIVAVLLVYTVGKSLVPRRAALLGAALYAVSVRAIWFAQEARAYSLSILLVLLAALTLIRLVENPTWRRAAIHALVGLLLLYTHVYAAFALAGMELMVPLSRRIRRIAWREWALAVFTMIVGYIPWILIVLRQANARAVMSENGSWSIDAPTGILTPMMEAINAFAPGPMKLIPYLGPIGWQATVFGGLVIFGVLSSSAFDHGQLEQGAPAREGSRTSILEANEKRIFLIGWLAFVFAGGLAVSLLILPIFTFRMAVVAMPALYLAAANGIIQLWKPAAILLLMATLVLSVMGLVPYYVDDAEGHIPEKEDWRGAIEHIIDEGAEYDAILVVPGWHADQMTEYSSGMKWTLSSPMTGVSRRAEGDALRTQYEPQIAEANTVMVIVGHASIDEEGLTVLEHMLLDSGEWEEDAFEKLRGVRIRRLERIAPATTMP